MSSSRSSDFLMCGAAVATLTLAMVAAPLAAQRVQRALCFLESFEAEMEEDQAMKHAVEMEVRCAHADRSVLEVAEFDLRLLDGEADLLESGIAWMKEYEEAGGTGYFSSQATNSIEVSEAGRERSVQLRAHSHAIPKTGVAHLEGTVDLVVEADCIGEGAIEPVTVETTAGALRTGAAIPMAAGGEIVATEQGQSGDAPMLGISGAGSYVAMVEPPDRVREHIFFGMKRIVVETDAADDAPVTLRICPTEVVRVPVTIEAAIWAL